MAKKTYNELLRDPRWQKRRLEILNRDKFTCSLCGDKETELHIHHDYYSKNTLPWEYPDEALSTLCAHCHYVVEELKKCGQTVIAVSKIKFGNADNIASLLVITECDGLFFYDYSIFGGVVEKISYSCSIDYLKVIIKLIQKVEVVKRA